MIRWYVVKTDRAEEYPVSRRLETRGFEVYLPMERQITIRRSERYLIERPFFPGYVLVRFDIGRDRWGQINTTRGVEQLMPLGREVPLPIPDGAVQEIRDHWQEHFASVSLDRVMGKKGAPIYAAGERVKVTAKANSFFGFEGTVMVPAHHRVRVLLSLFGRQTEVEMPVEQVALAVAGGRG